MAADGPATCGATELRLHANWGRAAERRPAHQRRAEQDTSPTRLRHRLFVTALCPVRAATQRAGVTTRPLASPRASHVFAYRNSSLF